MKLHFRNWRNKDEVLVGCATEDLNFLQNIMMSALELHAKLVKEIIYTV